MENKQSQPVFYMKYLRKLEPGTAINKMHLIYFLVSLLAYLVMAKFTLPIQSSKALFMIITVHFFLNFFYAFQAKIELEKILNHHFGMILILGLGIFCVLKTAPGYWFYMACNVPFLVFLVLKIVNGSSSKWNYMMLVLSVVCIVILYMYNGKMIVAVTDETTSEVVNTVVPYSLVSWDTWSWSLVLLVGSIFYGYYSFDKTNENVYHLGNLINFLLIAFLPFFFVLQKTEVPPMTNFFGYLLLIPTVLIGVVCLSFFYFFMANMKSLQMFSLINLLTVLYLFAYCNLYMCFLTRVSSLVVIFIYLLNFPLRNSSLNIDNFEESEITEEEIRNKNQSLSKIYLLRNILTTFFIKVVLKLN